MSQNTPTSPTPGTSQNSTELSVGRLTAALEHLGYTVVADDENPHVIRGKFDAYPFTFAVAGDKNSLLVVRGRWDQLLPVQLKLEAARTCNHWNMERMWPKVYVRRENEHALGVYGETVYDYHFGVSDAEIERAICCSLTTSIAFFHELDGNANLAPGDDVQAG